MVVQRRKSFFPQNKLNSFKSSKLLDGRPLGHRSVPLPREKLHTFVGPTYREIASSPLTEIQTNKSLQNPTISLHNPHLHPKMSIADSRQLPSSKKFTDNSFQNLQSSSPKILANTN